MKLVKVTELVGRHHGDIGEDYLISDGGTESVYVGLSDLLPPEAEGKRGRWRLTAEFEPDEGA